MLEDSVITLKRVRTQSMQLESFHSAYFIIRVILMNIFALKNNPKKPIKLTIGNYNKKTKRELPYVQTVKGEIKSYAICPDCNNPILLVNRYVASTQSETLYARHVPYPVHDIADYNQSEYGNCDLKNPTRLDSKIRRTKTNKNNELKEIFEQYIDLIILTLETTLQLKLTDNVIQSMIDHFKKNKGYEYKAVNMYNLPLAFAYMTEAQDLYGCYSSDSNLNQAIIEKSADFELFKTRYDKHGIKRKSNHKSHKLRFFFSEHTIKQEEDDTYVSESITFNIVEYKDSVENAPIIYSKKIFIDKSKFFNTLQRRIRFHQWVQAPH